MTNVLFHSLTFIRNIYFELVTLSKVEKEYLFFISTQFNEINKSFSFVFLIACTLYKTQNKTLLK